MEELHVGLVGLVQLELEIPEYRREGEVELCVGEAVLVLLISIQSNDLDSV